MGPSDEKPGENGERAGLRLPYGVILLRKGVFKGLDCIYFV